MTEDFKLHSLSLSLSFSLSPQSYAAMTDASSSPYDTLSPIEGAPVSLSPEHPSLQLSTADHKLNIPAATV